MKLIKATGKNNSVPIAKNERRFALPSSPVLSIHEHDNWIQGQLMLGTTVLTKAEAFGGPLRYPKSCAYRSIMSWARDMVPIGITLEII